MHNINNKGFTLVELLATISILAIIMLLAIPNIVGVVQRSRNKTYVEDAKKLVALAKYKVKSDSKVKKEFDDNYGYGGVCLYISYLDKSGEIKDAPNGGTYSKNNSYVQVTKEDNSYKYSVQLLETTSKQSYDNSNDYSNLQGLELVTSNDLAKDSIYKKIETTSYPKSCYGKEFK